MTLLFCFFGLPPIVKAQAIKRLSSAWQRKVAIERVRINPFVLSVTVEGLAIKDRDGGPLVGWKSLYLNFDSWSLFTGEWRFQEIALDGFSGRVVMNKDGSFNFSDLLPAHVGAPAPVASARLGRPFYIGKLAITSAAVGFADHTRGAPFSTAVGPLSLTLTDFRTAGDPRAPYAFSAVTESGETLDWRGTVSVNPARSVGEFSVGKIALGKYAPYYANWVRADVLGGTLDVSAHYVVDLTEGERVITFNHAVITFADLQIAERGATTPVIELPSVVIEGLSADALKRSASIKRVVFDRAHLSVRRDEGGAINLLSMFASVLGSTVLPDAKVAEVSVTKLCVDFEDLTTPALVKTTIEKLDLSGANFSLSEPSLPMAIRGNAVLAKGGELGVEGSVVRSPFAADLAIKIAAVQLAGFTPYIEPLLNLRITGGFISAGGKARVVCTAATFQGDVSVDHFSAVDGARIEEFVKFAALAIEGIDAGTKPLTAKVAAINLVDPVVRLTVNADKTTNVSMVLRKTDPVADAGKNGIALPRSPRVAPRTNTVAVTAPSPVWSLGKFTVDNATVALTDRSIKPAVQTALNQFSGIIGGLSSADSPRADVEFHGKVDGGGSVAITGKLDVGSVTPSTDAATDLAIAITGVDLSPFSPYVGTYAGYELASGSFAVDMKTHLARRKLNSANVVTLNQFSLGAATGSPDATKLPVRLGIALLKDIDGNIVIDLPVKGALDDPAFKIGAIIKHEIGNLLEKASSSPFALIGSMFGGGGAELAWQEFAPGAVNLLDSERPKIEILRKALKARPALNLDIIGGYDVVADTEAVRQQRLDQQVRARFLEELRAKDPSAAASNVIAVSAENETRLVSALFAEKFPAGAVVNPAGAVMAVPLPKPVVEPIKIVRTYQRGAPGSSKSATAPALQSFAPAASIVTVSQTMQVQQISVAPALSDMRRLLAAGITVTADDLRQLATTRAQEVRDALLSGGQVEATRLSIMPVPEQTRGARVLLQFK